MLSRAPLIGTLVSHLYTRLFPLRLWKRVMTPETMVSASPSPIASDLTLDATRFRRANAPEEENTAILNARLEYVAANGPKWWVDGAAKYRAKYEAGETPLPKPVYLSEAKETSVPSRDAGRSIPLREYKPDNGKSSSGVLLHFHGGGLVLGSHKHQDGLLRRWANACQVTVLSVGYRLAPEHPYPAAHHDALDAAEYLLDHAQSLYGAELSLLAGESAGANLAAAVAFHIMRTRPSASHQLAGLYFAFGHFDASLGLPYMTTFRRTLVINRERMERFRDAYLPDSDPEEWKNPLPSPIYEDMHTLVENSPEKKLPPALFVCGDQDPLLDDTLLMSSKWMATGSEACVKIYAGMPHGFTLFPNAAASEANGIADHFLQSKLGLLPSSCETSSSNIKKRRYSGNTDAKILSGTE